MKTKDYGQLCDTYEISVDWHGNHFLVIYGKHINGWFLAVTNWGVSVEITHPEMYGYNVREISKRLNLIGAAECIAVTVREHYKQIECERWENKEVAN